jgi:hypothetical protein
MYVLCPVIVGEVPADASWCLRQAVLQVWIVVSRVLIIGLDIEPFVVSSMPNGIDRTRDRRTTFVGSGVLEVIRENSKAIMGASDTGQISP